MRPPTRHAHALQRFTGARTPLRRLTTDASAVRDELRALLRDTAQPVAVVTAFMDPADPRPDAHGQPHFHGATLSSFSSIAMDPHPLVAFSLRIPSRMATALTAAHALPPPPQPSTPHSTPPPPQHVVEGHGSAPHPARAHATAGAHMVVNILSARQAPAAVRFSRPDLHPAPFAALPYTLSREGLPVLAGAVGALSCRLVAASWPLHDLRALAAREGTESEEWAGEGVASELFIAQVVRVERPAEVEGQEAEQEKGPLLYYRRGYVTTRPIEEAEDGQSPR